jgi:hypothetical protein
MTRNETNVLMMARNIEALGRMSQTLFIAQVLRALYPDGDMNHEWSPDTLADIAHTVEALHLKDGTESQ